MASRACSPRINNPTECKAHTSPPPTLSRDFLNRDTRRRDFPARIPSGSPTGIPAGNARNGHAHNGRAGSAGECNFCQPPRSAGPFFLMSNATCGPTDLGHVFGSSPATWSRELSNLQRSGFIHKHGQKYMLTETGRAWIEEQMPREDVNNG